MPTDRPRHTRQRGIADRDDGEAEQRREAILATSGALTGAYPDEYLERLRDDWPE